MLPAATRTATNLQELHNVTLHHFEARPDHPYSPAVRAGDWLFVSGQASTDPVTREIVLGTFDEEFSRSVANLQRVLALAGAGMEHVVKITAVVSDGGNLARYNQLYLELFDHPRPARTTMVNPGKRVQIELECQAYLGA